MTLFFFVPKDNPEGSKLFRCGHGSIADQIRALYQETHGNMRFRSYSTSNHSGIESYYNVSGETLESRTEEELGSLFEIP